MPRSGSARTVLVATSVVRPLHRAWIVATSLLTAACGAATPQSADDAPRIASATSNVGQSAGKNAHVSDRLARAVHAPKTLENGCPSEMAPIDTRSGRYCIDRWEASLVEVDETGAERPHSPYYPVQGATVRAVSRPGVFPQAYISEKEASFACARSDKRLCKPMEWRKACVGPEPTIYGYGNRSEPGRCNDHGRSPVLALFGPHAFARSRYAWDVMNYPKLNQLDGTLAKTGDHPGCTNGYGVFDMVGNLHEWVADPGGTFYGGFYQDTHLHGDGCTYVTVAHNASYHDYSTGFRCCADARE